MHDLLSFVPRPRTKPVPPNDGTRRMLEELIDDIQIIALHNRIEILEVMAQFAHEQRARMHAEEHDEQQHTH